MIVHFYFDLHENVRRLVPAELSDEDYLEAVIGAAVDLNVTLTIGEIQETNPEDGQDLQQLVVEKHERVIDDIRAAVLGLATAVHLRRLDMRRIPSEDRMLFERIILHMFRLEEESHSEDVLSLHGPFIYDEAMEIFMSAEELARHVLVNLEWE